MASREEIREGVEKFISKAYWYEGRKNIVVSITNELIAYLHDNDVVIKRETTDFIKCPCDDCEHKLIDEWGYFCDLFCGQRSHWISQCAGANEARKAGYEPLVRV